MRCERTYSSLLKALALSILVAIFMWSYWPQLLDLWSIWQKSDEYSCGLLVPFLAVYVLYARRQEITQVPLHPCIYGLFALIVVQALRYFGLFFMYSSAERLSVPLSIASLTLLLFGWRLLNKILPVLLFLFLMLPLPQSVHRNVMLPLQNLATTSAAFCLEIMGYAVIREGNIIHLNDTTVAVAEACNGLRMVTAFFVVITLVVLLVRREWWEKMIILISNLPIALLCNILRLTITAIAFTIVTGEEWEEIFHDFGGYLMMPLALAVVTLELWLLKKLTTVGEKVEQKIIVQRAYC
jgi:exosortase